MKRTQIADHNNALIKQTLLIVLQSSKKCSIEYLAYMHFPGILACTTYSSFKFFVGFGQTNDLFILVIVLQTPNNFNHSTDPFVLKLNGKSAGPQGCEK